MTSPTLPVPVQDYPHWRVNIRPHHYKADLIPSLSECFDVIAATKVSLRGWDYPHLGRRAGEVGTGSSWVASWSEFLGHLEYWRLYQSGQFLHLFAVREAMVPEWRAQLQGFARGHVSYRSDIDWDKVPGFFSLLNFLYTVTEVFEFSARLAQHGTYQGDVRVEIGIHRIKGFALTPDFDRAWSEHRVASEDSLVKEWQMPSTDLIANSADASIDATVWFFERFGWLSPSVDVMRRDQAKFLKGLV